MIGFVDQNSTELAEEFQKAGLKAAFSSVLWLNLVSIKVGQGLVRLTDSALIELMQCNSSLDASLQVVLPSCAILFGLLLARRGNRLMSEENQRTPIEGGASTVGSGDQSKDMTDRPILSDSAKTTGEKASEGSARPKTEFERKLGMANTMFQMVAILVAGLFAYYKFFVLDRPTLESQANVSGQLQWVEVTDSSCIAQFDVEVKNQSKSDMDIRVVHGRSWLFDRQVDFSEPIKYLDIEQMTGTAKPVEFEYEKGPLAQAYRPGQGAHQTFQWAIKRPTKKYAMFEIAVFRNQKDLKSGKFLDHQVQWSPTCGEDYP